MPSFKSTKYVTLLSSDYSVSKKRKNKNPYTKFKISVAKKRPKPRCEKISYTQLAGIVTEDIFQ